MPYAFYGHCWVHFFSQAKRPKWRNIEAQKAKMKKNEGPKGQNGGNWDPKSQNERKWSPIRPGGPHGCVCVCVTPLTLKYDS